MTDADFFIVTSETGVSHFAILSGNVLMNVVGLQNMYFTFYAFWYAKSKYERLWVFIFELYLFW